MNHNYESALVLVGIAGANKQDVIEILIEQGFNEDELSKFDNDLEKYMDEFEEYIKQKSNFKI